MDVFKGRLRAVEGSYYKREQEEELKEYRRKRVSAGALTQDLAGAVSEAELGAASDKLAEISAQETRLSAPADKLRFKGSSQFPPTSAAGSRRGSSAWGQQAWDSPRTSLGRTRWSVPVADAALLPEETAAQQARKAVAERAMRAGTRALGYGSAAAVVVVALATRYALDALDVRSEADLRRVCGEALAPLVARCRAAAAPLSAEGGWGERLRLAGAGVSEGDGAFAEALRRSSAFRGVARGEAGEQGKTAAERASTLL